MKLIRPREPRTTDSRHVKHVVAIICVILLLVMIPAKIHAATYTWDGGSIVDGNWSTEENWNPDGPIDDTDAWDTFRFGGNLQLSSISDTDPNIGGWNVVGIDFLPGAGAFTISDTHLQGLDMLGPQGGADSEAIIVNNSSNLQTLSLKLIHRPDLNAGLVFNGANEKILVNGSIVSANAGENDPVIIRGSNEVEFAGNNMYSTPTLIESNSILRLTHANGLGTTNQVTTVESRGRLVLSGGITVTGKTVRIDNDGGTNPVGGGAYRGALQNGSGNNIWAGPVLIDSSFARIGSVSGTLTVSGVISDGNGNDFRTRSSTGGTVILSGKSDYTGATSIVGGTTQLAGGADRLPVTTELQIGVSTVSGKLDLNGQNQTVAGLTVAQTGGADTNEITSTSGTPTLTVNNSTDNTYSGLLSGSLGLTKSGAGKLILRTRDKTYNGDTTISSGTLEMDVNRIKNSPNIRIGDGATLLSTGVFTLAANQSIIGTGGTGSIQTDASGLRTTSGTTISSSGTMNIRRFDVKGTGNQITGGDIRSGSAGNRGLLVGSGTAGSHDLTITGGSITTLGAGLSFDVIGNGAGTGTLVINGGSYVNTSTKLSLGFGGSGRGTLTLASGSATINEVEFNSGAGTKSTINLDGGTLTASALTQSSGTPTINFNGGQLVAGNDLGPISGYNLNIENGGAQIDTNGHNVSINDPLVAAGTGGLTKDGTGTLTLTGTSTYTGDTTISGGTLQAGAAASGQAFGILSAVTLADTAGATLDLNNFDQTIGSLAGGGVAGGNVDLGTGTLTTGGDNSSTTYSGEISGSGGLIKTGTGTLSLAGDNGYTGLTAVNTGTLLVNGSIAGDVNIAPGAQLGGSGSVGGAIDNSGVISPGNSPGQLTVGSITNLGTYLWDVFDVNAPDDGSGWDHLTVTGNVNALTGHEILVQGLLAVGTPDTPGLPPTLDISVEGATSPAFAILTVGSLTGDFATLDAIPVNPGNLGQYGYFTRSLGGPGNNTLFLTFTSTVPEPGTWALFGLLTIGGIFSVRRRNQA